MNEFYFKEKRLSLSFFIIKSKKISLSLITHKTEQMYLSPHLPEADSVTFFFFIWRLY